MSYEPSDTAKSPTVTVGDTIFGLPYADLLPPLDDSDLSALRGDIAARQAVIVPIVIDEARNVIDGASLARFLVFRSTVDIPDRNRRAAALTPVPAALVAALQRVAAIGAGTAAGNLQGIAAPVIKPDPLVVAMDGAATAIFDALDDEMTARQRAAVGSDQSAALARVTSR